MKWYAKRVSRISIFTFGLVWTSVLYAQPAYYDTLLNRYNQFLLEQTIVNSEGISRVLGSLSSEGQWKDIDYKGTSIGSWQLKEHLDRMVILAKAYNKKGTAFYQSSAVKVAIDLSLKHWTINRYKNSNWWYNAILTPQHFRDIIILMAKHLSPEQRADALGIMAQHHVGGTGANLTWTADIGIHYGALTGNDSLLNKCAKLLPGEIKQNGEEGIQPDYSFRQHGARLQMYHYGKAFVFENIRLAWQLKGTPWAYPQKSIDLLINVVVEGYWWMARGVQTVPSTVDRAVSRVDQLKVADIRSLIPYLKQLSPANIVAFEKLNAWQSGDYSILKGYRHYPYSDFTVYHNKDFSFFIKTISTRTLITESINNENLKGSGLNNANTWMLSQGNEYDNLMPVWDWTQLPGSTVANIDLKISKHSYCGGAGNDESGITAMQYGWSKNDSSLLAEKAWAIHNGVAICLTAGIELKGLQSPIFTTLDQCRLRGNVSTDKSTSYPLGLHRIQNPTWIHHAGMLYMPLSESEMELHLEEKYGAWTDVNKNGSANIISEQVFMPVWLHKKKEVSIAYAITACAKPEDASLKASHKPWQILANNTDCQAILFNDGVFMLALYKADSKQSAIPIQANRPCIVLKKEKTLFIVDPLHQGGEVIITVNNKKYHVNVPADGTVQQLTLSKDYIK